MKEYNAKTVDKYISQLSEERKVVLTLLRNIIKQNLPEGFVEQINYKIPGYVIPKSMYPKWISL